MRASNVRAATVFPFRGGAVRTAIVRQRRNARIMRVCRHLSGVCEEAKNHTCSKKSGCCTSDSSCSNLQYCSANKCVNLSCGVCEQGSFHSCVKKSGCCTSDADCSGSQKCQSNKCVSSSQGSSQGSASKTCVRYATVNASDYGQSCTSNSQCSMNLCAPVSIINAAQGSTCRGTTQGACIEWK